MTRQEIVYSGGAVCLILCFSLIAALNGDKVFVAMTFMVVPLAVLPLGFLIEKAFRVFKGR